VGYVDHLTSLWVPALAASPGAQLVALDELVRTLRTRCPWDREQTHESLRRHLLEESYEVIDAIDVLVRTRGSAVYRSPPDDPSGGEMVSEEELSAAAHLEEELGDLLFQVYFHATLATEEGYFTLEDVARGIREKLVGRHPHVFGDAVADDAAAVLEGWERAKLAEKGRRSVTDGIPPALPALALVATLQRKAQVVEHLAHAGFAETRDALVNGLVTLDPAETETADLDGGGSEEIGRLLFLLADLGRQLGVDTEAALRSAAHRFAEEVRRAEVP
jgi:tetrapyrrole methylase family protein / MazG family protein